MNSVLQVKKICSHCGTSFEVDVDVKDKDSLCPASNCYGKKTKCIKCDDFAKFTQPDKETGHIVDVCDKHFYLKYMG